MLQFTRLLRVNFLELANVLVNFFFTNIMSGGHKHFISYKLDLIVCMYLLIKFIFYWLELFQAMRSHWAVSHWLFGGMVTLAGGEGDTPGDMFPRWVLYSFVFVFVFVLTGGDAPSKKGFPGMFLKCSCSIWSMTFYSTLQKFPR